MLPPKEEVVRVLSRADQIDKVGREQCVEPFWRNEKKAYYTNLPLEN